jgi:hypothetical protein
MENFAELLPLLIPLAVIELGMRAFAIFNILKGKKQGVKFRFDPIVWIVVSAFVTFGWVIYLIFGRIEE